MKKHLPIITGFAILGVILLLCNVLVARPSESSFSLIQTIPLKGAPGTLDHLVVDAKNQRLFVANKANNTFDIVDLKSGSLVKQLDGQQGVQGIGYAADLDRLFVALGSGGFCNVFDGKDYKLLKTIKFKDDADNVRYLARMHTVYVAHADNAMGVIDANSFDVRADIKLPASAEGMQLESQRPRLYVTTPQPSLIVVIDTDKNEVIGRYPVRGGKAYSVAMDEAGRRLFVGCRQKPTLVVMDPDSGKEIANLPIPNGIDDIAYDATRKRIYASCGEGFIAVIRQTSPDRYEMLEKIPTVKDAKTCCFSEPDGKLYLAVPRQPGKEGPEIRIYQAGR